MIEISDRRVVSDGRLWHSHDGDVVARLDGKEDPNVSGWEWGRPWAPIVEFSKRNLVGEFVTGEKTGAEK